MLGVAVVIVVVAIDVVDVVGNVDVVETGEPVVDATGVFVDETTSVTGTVEDVVVFVAGAVANVDGGSVVVTAVDATTVLEVGGGVVAVVDGADVNGDAVGIGVGIEVGGTTCTSGDTVSVPEALPGDLLPDDVSVGLGLSDTLLDGDSL